MILQTLSALALGELIEAGVKAVGLPDVDANPDSIVGLLAQRFIDHGQKLVKALAESSDRAWRALEVSLAGEGLWNWLDRAEDRAFRQQVRAFLDAAAFQELPGRGADYRKQALCELRHARKEGLLADHPGQPADLARKAVDFSRCQDAHHLVQAHWAAVERIADAVHSGGYRHLSHFLRLRPDSGAGGESAPLLALAVRYFFRRAVESDAALFQGMTFTRLEGMARTQEAGFAALESVLGQHERSLEATLDVLTGLRDEVQQLRQDLNRLDVRAEQQRIGEHLQTLHRDVLRALEQGRVGQRELRPRDSLSLQGDAERQLVKQLVARYRALPATQQEQLPALLNALAKLEVASGDYDNAQRDFHRVSALVGDDDRARAEVHHNAYRTALERGDRERALRELGSAVQLDAARFSPFPFEKFEPERILGAGGFGVAFLCRHRFLKTQVVVKSLLRDDLGHDVNQVFAEALHLRQLNHPAIVGLQDCGFADPSGEARPYLVMDYFEGQTLEEFVKQYGPISRRELPRLGQAVASGLHAAHGKGILHRDVKPANILVRRTSPSPSNSLPHKGERGSQRSCSPLSPSVGEGGGGGEGWEVKLIDFGLALSQTTMQGTAPPADTLSRSVVGLSIAGTLDYAAPEQMGKIKGAAVTFASDVYGFGRTCAFALFQTPNIGYQEWKEIEGPLANLLGQCLQENPRKRLPNFTAVLQRLDALTRTAPSAAAARLIPKVNLDPVRPRSREPVLAVEPMEVLEALPVAEDLPEALPVRPSRRSARKAPRAKREEQPRVARNHADVTVTFGGHTVRVECSVWTNKAAVHHDGRLMGTGWPLVEGNHVFQVDEDGEVVQYEVAIRGPAMSFLVRPYFTIRRNGMVLFNDR